MFEHVESYPGDPILSLVGDFNEDQRENKVNLGIGYYYDENGVLPVLKSVKIAKEFLYHNDNKSPGYLPMSGIPAYIEVVKTLVFGEACLKSHHHRIATIQTIGGSGALKVGADFLFKYFPKSEVWVSDPTWENHISIFNGAGFTVKKYPYFDQKTQDVDFDNMLSTIIKLPKHTIVLLHPCCHNPTGADLTQAQWDELLQVIKNQNLIPFMDIAYQGFGKGIDEDAYAIKALTNLGLCGLVANSFSKTFSLYNERVGGLSVICDDEHTNLNVNGQLKAAVRHNYSSPPLNGARIITHVLNDASLNALWRSEVNEMRERILMMRSQLHQALKQKNANKSFDFLLSQQGMFSYTGFNKDQVNKLKTHYGVYLVASGRVCVAGVNEHNMHQIVTAFSAI